MFDRFACEASGAPAIRLWHVTWEVRGEAGQNGTPQSNGTSAMTLSVVVARANADGLEYLAHGASAEWTKAAAGARQFANLREATRAAMRLPSRLRAFALPLN